MYHSLADGVTIYLHKVPAKRHFNLTRLLTTFQKKKCRSKILTIGKRVNHKFGK